jgi:hypothetical protein
LLLPGCEAVDVPFVKARRAIGFACRNAEAPLRRAERAASWAMEFMMILMELMMEGGVLDVEVVVER